MIKKYRSFFMYFIFSLFSIFIIHANKPQHTSKFYINDFANILDQETKDYIYSQSKSLNNKTSIQLVVTTVESIENETIETFANELFRSWGIGNKDKNNGLLILLALNERKIRIEVGYGLESIMNDAKARRFLRTYANPYLNKNEFSKGILSLYKATLSEITPKEQSSKRQNSNTEKKNNIFSKLNINDIAACIHFSIFVLFIIGFIKQSIYGPPGGSGGWSDGGSSGGDSSGGSSDSGGFSGGSSGGSDCGGGGSSGGGGASSGF